MADQGNQGNRDREGNLGQSGNDATNPTGTSGRQGTTDKENWQPGEKQRTRQPGDGPHHWGDEDEDSALGTRNTNR
jgi:hypothetical protein